MRPDAFADEKTFPLLAVRSHLADLD